MLRHTFIFLFFLIAFGGYAQTDTTSSGAEPIGGINRLALVYYSIEFTKEQRKLLENVPVEMIFSVSKEGVAKLEHVNGIQNRSLIDSLYAQTPKVPGFKPEIHDGMPRESLYFMKFRYPTYKMNTQEIPIRSPFYQKKINKDEFLELDETGRGFDFTVLGIFTNHFGKPDKYFKPGGGVQIGCEYVSKIGLYYGFGFDMYGNPADQHIAREDTMPYLRSPFSVTTGIYVGFRFDRLYIQSEAYYSTIAISRSDTETAIGGTSYEGFSPGLFANYIIPFRKNRERVTIHVGQPYINRASLNIRGGFRGFFMDSSEVSGIMLELGVGIRFGSYFVKKYHLKDSYYDN